LKHGHGNFL
jgi:Glycosyltransferase